MYIITFVFFQKILFNVLFIFEEEKIARNKMTLVGEYKFTYVSWRIQL